MLSDLPRAEARSLLRRYGLELVVQQCGESITGSFWGESEAGIVGRSVYARADTPIHSLLHETCHTICMSTARRQLLHRDAGGDDLEEAAVCYLQILLADQLEGVGRKRLMADMDACGYSFRLGSTATWFGNDSDDAYNWLIKERLIDGRGAPTFHLRR